MNKKWLAYCALAVIMYTCKVRSQMACDDDSYITVEIHDRMNWLGPDFGVVISISEYRIKTTTKLISYFNSSWMPDADWFVLHKVEDVPSGESHRLPKNWCI